MVDSAFDVGTSSTNPGALDRWGRWGEYLGSTEPAQTFLRRTTAIISGYDDSGLPTRSIYGTGSTTSPTVSMERILNLLTASGISIVKPNKTRRYLVSNPDMLALLIPVCDKVKHSFSPSSSMSLELYEDPDENDRYLTLIVRQLEYQNNILDELKQIALGFGEEMSRLHGWLLLTTDFQPPR
jgi:hypothetical protein